MVKWRLLLLLILCLYLWYYLSPKTHGNLRERMRGTLRYVVQAVTAALILYWLFVVLRLGKL
jgi:cytochrome bd-type quinol oxidase subunit 2